MSHKGDWFTTWTGRQFFPYWPEPCEIVIEDIAHSLSMQCRYQGHVREFYSVAQHSLMVSMLVPRSLALVGLLHDATEAYCGDMIRPIKRDMLLYRQMESAIWRAVCSKFGFPFEVPQEVKHADKVALVTERRDLVTKNGLPWKEDEEGITPVPFPLVPLPPATAESMFLSYYEEYKNPTPEAA